MERHVAAHEVAFCTREGVCRAPVSAQPGPIPWHGPKRVRELACRTLKHAFLRHPPRLSRGLWGQRAGHPVTINFFFEDDDNERDGGAGSGRWLWPREIFPRAK